jgi:hypothetical protein
VNPPGADGNKDAPFLRRPDRPEVYGRDRFLAVQQGVVQVTDNQSDFLSQLPYKILFHNQLDSIQVRRFMRAGTPNIPERRPA